MTVLACGNVAVRLRLVEEAFDRVPVALQEGAEGRRVPPVRHRLDVGPGALVDHGLAQGIAVVRTHRSTSSHVASFRTSSGNPLMSSWPRLRPTGPGQLDPSWHLGAGCRLGGLGNASGCGGQRADAGGSAGAGRRLEPTSRYSVGGASMAL